MGIDIDRLSELAARIGENFKEGETVFRQGEKGDTMYIIHEGAVAVIREQDATGTVVARLDQGDFFGEMALVDQEPRSATVTTLEKTSLVPVTRDFLLKHSRTDTRFILAVIESLGIRLEKVNEMLKLRFATSKTRLGPVTDQNMEEPRSAAFLKGFSSVAETSKAVRFNEGDIIFRQGQPGDKLFIILEGQVEIIQDAEESALIQARFGRGNFFGEMALVSGHARAATARAASQTILLPVSRDVFLRCIQSDPEVAFHAVQILILRLRRALQMLH
jgi:CPA1 family monovalent cation:H+ antiporter